MELGLARTMGVQRKPQKNKSRAMSCSVPMPKELKLQEAAFLKELESEPSSNVKKKKKTLFVPLRDIEKAEDQSKVVSQQFRSGDGRLMFPPIPPVRVRMPMEWD